MYRPLHFLSLLYLLLQQGQRGLLAHYRITVRPCLSFGTPLKIGEYQLW